MRYENSFYLAASTERRVSGKAIQDIPSSPPTLASIGKGKRKPVESVEKW